MLAAVRSTSAIFARSASRIVLPRAACIAMDAAASASAAAPAASLHVETRLSELGLRLPAAAKPVASYVMCTRVGNLLYLGTCEAAK